MKKTLIFIGLVMLIYGLVDIYLYMNELKRMADIGEKCQSDHWWVEKWNIEEHKELLNE